VSDTKPDLDALKASAKEAGEAVKAAKDALKADPENKDLAAAVDTAKATAKAANQAVKDASPKDDTPKPKAEKAPKTTMVYSPNRQFTGDTAGITFVNGNGAIPADHPKHGHLVDWFRRHGYTIGGDAPSE